MGPFEASSLLGRMMRHAAVRGAARQRIKGNTIQRLTAEACRRQGGMQRCYSAPWANNLKSIQQSSHPVPHYLDYLRYFSVPID